MSSSALEPSKTSHLNISWDKQLRCVVVELVGFLESSQFRAGMEQALTLLKEHKGHLWLADLRAFRIADLSDQDWLTNEWLPRAKVAGLRYSASVVPTSAIGRLMARRVETNAADQDAQYFTSLMMAKDWLGQRQSTTI